MKRCLLLWMLATMSALAATRTAPTCSANDVQITLNASTDGDTVIVPPGSCSWGAGAVTTTHGITLQGQTVCTGNGDPNGGTSGVISCIDKTNITVTGEAALNVSASSPNVVQVTGFTFLNNLANSLQGQEVISSGTLNCSGCFRFFGNHLKMSQSNSRNLVAYNYGGLIDLNYFQDVTTSGTASDPLDFFGNFGTKGYTDWNNPTNLGSANATYIERNYYTSPRINTEGFYDATAGAKIVLRFNTIIGNEIGGSHGTDSGFSRSTVLNEIYNNSLTNAAGTFGAMDIRGGTLLFFNNTLLGLSTLNNVHVDYYRFGARNPFSTSWGTAGLGIAWTPLTTDQTTDLSKTVTNGAADFIALHPYAANAVVGPLSNNASHFNYQLSNGPRTCGTYPGTWTQGYPSTTTDSAGCTWLNVGGSTSAKPAGAGFCAVNPDTVCSADSTCNALSPGDTCSRFLDSPGATGYPYRDMYGRGHNQVLMPVYEWGQTGAGAPVPIFSADGAGTLNVDYYNFNASFTGTTGVGKGTLAARPATCTTGVAYWATDQGSWNQSGDGSGSGLLYQCGPTNTWTLYYTPFQFPHPLAGGAGPVVTTTSPLPSGLIGSAYSTTLAATGGGITWSITAGSLPPALSLNTSTGVISGTPATAGTFTFTATATNVNGSGSKFFSLSIGGIAPVIITGATIASATINQPYTFTFQASGTAPITWALTSGAFPTGITLNGSTGVISGTPTVAGNFSFTLLASNSFGSASRKFSLAVNGVAPIIQSANPLPAGTITVPYTVTLVATGTPPITWALVSGTLPTSTSLNTSTGVISGTPSAVGTFSFRVSATNGSGSNQKNLSIIINAIPPTITTATPLPQGTVGTAYSTTISASGTAPITFALASGTLPTSLSLNTSTGAITGTPTVAGTSSFTISATNSGGSASKAFSLTIIPTPTAPTITTSSPLPQANVNSFYTTTLAATGTIPITWSVTVGSLPTGMTLAAGTGIISGTATSTGTSNFTIQATNTAGTNSKAFTLVVGTSGSTIAGAAKVAGKVIVH